MGRFSRFVTGSVILAGLALGQQASAVILYSSSERNTSAPGSLTNHGPYGDPKGPSDPRRLLNSGWQWQGEFGSFLGTPIASQYFLTADHFGTASDRLRLGGVDYLIDSTFNNNQGFVKNPVSDLRIYKISGTFPTFAPLYLGGVGSELNRPMIVFGRGTARGAEVRVNGELKGWQWGSFDSVPAWGENVVSSVVNFGGEFGNVLAFSFDADGGPNEAGLSAGDSGGAVFIPVNNTWRLAGINLGVDGAFRFVENGPEFSATIFDMGGLWVNNYGQFFTDQATNIPGRSYSTAISANRTWIEGIIGTAVVPEPSSALMLLASAGVLLRRRR